MPHLRPEERWAALCIEATTGGDVSQHDDGSRPGMYDLDITHVDGRTGAVEVTSATHAEETQFWKLVTVADGVARGQFVAYAVDLPVRESRVSSFLEGHRAPGLVTADADDLASVRSALQDARAGTASIAADVSGPAARRGGHGVLAPGTAQAQHHQATAGFATTASAQDGVPQRLRRAR